MNKFILILLIQIFLSTCWGKIIKFDKIEAGSDAERLRKLPVMIKSEIKNLGTAFSLRGGNPQPGYLFTTVKVKFSNKIYDFSSIDKPVDLGQCFELSGDGRPVFKCGVNGFIKFSQRKAIIENISFVGKRNKIPPVIIYSAKEKGLGSEADAGNIVIRDCYFKGFAVVIRSRKNQHTNSAMFKIQNSVFYNCYQLTDNLKFDGALITGCWLCPTFTSDKAFIVNHGSMIFQNNICVPQSDVKPLKNLRWFDNYGLNLCILSSRFGNETVNKKNPVYGEQVSLVYNYVKFRTSHRNKSMEFELDRNALIIRDNVLYARNVPVVKLFEIPNHLSITGNTGLIGKIYNIKERKYFNQNCMLGLNDLKSQPTEKDKKAVLIYVKDNISKIRLFKSNKKIGNALKSILNKSAK